MEAFNGKLSISTSVLNITILTAEIQYLYSSESSNMKIQCLVRNNKYDAAKS